LSPVENKSMTFGKCLNIQNCSPLTRTNFKQLLDTALSKIPQKRGIYAQFSHSH
jgi:hypothetical protein